MDIIEAVNMDIIDAVDMNISDGVAYGRRRSSDGMDAVDIARIHSQHTQSFNGGVSVARSPVNHISKISLTDNFPRN